jgi:CheY-like chemotaxis protein
MKNTASILIVDDDADDREIISDAFRSNNDKAEYTSLESGEALLQYLTENKNNGLPALILLDLNMPGKDGREVLREIKSTGTFQKIPTIVFTTSASDRDRQNAYETGANCFITKPDTFDKLVEITGCILKLWLPEE